MKSVPDELLRAVLDAPDDDAPRLVVADMLANIGDPRGELIAVQCALAGPAPLSKTKRAHLERRERALLKEHEWDWLEDSGLASRTARGPQPRCTFRRGFIEAVEVGNDLGPLPSRWDQLPIREVGVGARPALLALRDHPRFATLRRLQLRGARVEPDELAALAATRIESLLLAGDSLTEEHGRALGALPLRELTLGAAETNLKTIDALTAGPLPRHLRVLDLRQGPQGTAGVVAAAPWARLQTLCLVSCRVTDDEAISLSRAEPLSSIEKLDLSLNHIGDRGVTAIAASTTWHRLRSLGLSHNALIRDAASLADPASLPSLQDLDLRYVHHLGDSTKEALVAGCSSSE